MFTGLVGFKSIKGLRTSFFMSHDSHAHVYIWCFVYDLRLSHINPWPNWLTLSSNGNAIGRDQGKVEAYAIRAKVIGLGLIGLYKLAKFLASLFQRI